MKINIKILLTGLLVSFSALFVKGQDFSEFQLNKIKENSTDIIRKFGSYMNLIGDIKESEEDRYLYQKSLIGLFLNENVYVYNDLDPEQKSGKQFPINTYCSYINQWYTAVGLKTDLNIKTLKFGEILKQGDKYFIKVMVEKSLSGVYLRQTPNQLTLPLEFRIAFESNDLSSTGFKIVEIVKQRNKPGAAGQITGKTTVKQGSVAKYEIQPVEEADIYIWTFPKDASGSSQTNSVMVEFGLNSESGIITVKPKNEAGEGNASSIQVEIEKLLPSDAGVIKGKTAVKPDEKGVIYAIPEIQFANSYEWSLPFGATGSSSTNFITVEFTKTAKSGEIVVKGKNTGGYGKESRLMVTVERLLPADAGIISGKSSITAGEKNLVYSIDPIQNATSYLWTLPTGFIGQSNTQQINVNVDLKALSSEIRVKGQNEIGFGKESFLSITIQKPVILPGNAGSISGKTIIKPNDKGIVYSVPSIEYATSYLWTLPKGATGQSITNKIMINFDDSFESGIIKVKGKNQDGVGKEGFIEIKAIKKEVTVKEERKRRTMEIGIVLGGGPSQINNSINEATTKGKTGSAGLIQMNYFFTKNFGMITGIGLSNYSSDLTLSQYNTTLDVNDIDMDSYQKKINISNLTETQKISFLDVPLGFKTRIGFSKVFLNINLGMQISIPTTKTFSNSGNYTIKGYYPQYKLEIYNVPQAGFIENENQNKTGDMEIKTNTSAFASAGICIPFSNKIQMYLGVYYEQGLNSISSKNTDVIEGNQSLITNSSKTTTSLMTGQIGILYRIK